MFKDIVEQTSLTMLQQICDLADGSGETEACGRALAAGLQADRAAEFTKSLVSARDQWQSASGQGYCSFCDVKSVLSELQNKSQAISKGVPSDQNSGASSIP